MIINLTDLIAPLSCSDFLESLRASRRLHVRGSSPDRAASLLPWHDIDALLDVLARADELLIMRDGKTVPKQFYTVGEDKRFNTRAFHDLVAQGVSVIVNSIDKTLPRIGHLAAAIERELGIHAWVNAYLSFSKGGAFNPHWDLHDVLVVQIHGNKQWQVWKSDVQYPVDKKVIPKHNISSAPDQLIELAPGDVLFIPRGELHSAAVSSGSSVHLTIGLEHVTSLNFIDHLRNEAAANTVLGMNLPRHSSEEETVAHEAAVKQALFQLIDSASIADFLRADDLGQPPYLHTTASGVMPKLDD